MLSVENELDVDGSRVTRKITLRLVAPLLVLLLLNSIDRVNMSFADGSVHYISEEVDPLLYKSLGSRNGAEQGTKSLN